MKVLSSEHIDFIIKDLHRRGIVLDDIEDELIDHVCSAVEARMESGERFADAYQQVIKSFGDTGGLQNTQSQILLTQTKSKNYMLRNHFSIAIRHLVKGRMYTAINIAGLAIGIASCLLIALYVQQELSYEAWNPNADHVYRVHTEIKFGPNHAKLANGPAPVANALQNEYPEIEATCRLLDNGQYLVRAEHESVNQRETKVVWADSTFFKVFSVPVIAGNPDKALTEAHSFAISRKMAEKYFPNDNALGKIMILDNNRTGKVTAVFENIPSATHFHFDIVIGVVGDWPICRSALSQDFLTGSWATYLLLRSDATGKELESKLPAFTEKYMGKAMGVALGTEFNMDAFTRDGNKYEVRLMPLRDIHLNSDLIGEFEANGRLTYVYMFGTIALLILVIACVNFMNLSTARSGTRAKEVGVRKVLGSLRAHLVKQFLMESIVLSTISFVTAFFIAWAMIPMFNNLSQKQLVLPFESGIFWASLTGAALAIGALAGLYPSLFLSSFKPVAILKGSGTTSGRSVLRNGLVVFQFAISILLIVGTITVNRQLGYIQSKRIGFDRSQIIVVKDGYALRPTPEVFKTEALKISSIERGTMSGFVPIDSREYNRNTNATWREGQSPSPENMVNLQLWGVDEDYIPTYGMNVVEGRNFSKEFLSDKSALIINQAAAKLFNFEGGPVGKKLNSFMGDDATKENTQTFTIIGVVEDFNYASMRVNVGPLAFVYNPSDNGFSFKFHASRTKETVDALEATWKKIAPNEPFNYTFLDQEFSNMYAAEERLGNTFSVFSTLAIIIAGIGLFALTAFTAEQRTKEIGIRKVLGASVPGIVILLSKEFGKLIVIAFLIAIPVAWYGVTWWLQGYAFKTTVGVGVYALAGSTIAVVALVTMSFQSIKAALANPVKSLRSQ